MKPGVRDRPSHCPRRSGASTRPSARTSTGSAGAVSSSAANLFACVSAKAARRRICKPVITAQHAAASQSPATVPISTAAPVESVIMMNGAPAFAGA